MNYELAKKLKDAGFPQEDARCGNCRDNDNHYCSVCRDAVQSTPTLSELMEWLGERFGALYNIPESPPQKAMYEAHSSDCNGPVSVGKTPLEALGNLAITILEHAYICQVAEPHDPCRNCAEV